MKSFLEEDNYAVLFRLTGLLLILVVQFRVLPSNACPIESNSAQMIDQYPDTTTVTEPLTISLSANVISHQANKEASSDSGANLMYEQGLTFDAVVEKNRVLTTWMADPVQNNGFFVLERSLDAIFFEPIGVVPGNELSNTTQEYSLLDVYPFNGLSYYRLKHASHDGSSEYSQMVEVNFKRTDVNQLPNSNNSIITLEITDSEGNLANVRAFNSDAKMIYEHLFHIESNRHELQIDLTGYSPGRYSIICSMGNVSMKRSVVIQ